MTTVDAIVIGAGPNGLTAANLLADRGWDVLVLEANDEPGGAVRTGGVTAPGFRNDLYSAFYPLGAASPVITGLHLEDHGLRWVHAPHVLAHPRPDAPGALLDRDPAVTAASLDADTPGDGDAYLELHARWERVGPALIAGLLSPFPPVRGGIRLAAATLGRDARDTARMAIMPVRRMVEERFRGEAARLLFAGNALHADLTPESAGSSLFGWLLVALGQTVGFPVPEGGAGQIIAAMVRRLEAGGGALRTGTRVETVRVEHGRATGVVIAGGEVVHARRAVLADTHVVALYEHLVGVEHLPAKVVAALDRFQAGSGTIKVDWALSGPIPWIDEGARRAGTVHVAHSLDELTRSATDLAVDAIPADPFLLIGQMTTTDPTRSPAGTESAWAYTHVPQLTRRDSGPDGLTGRWDEAELATFASRMEARIEELAPGFGDLVLARHLAGPHELEAANANLRGGDIGGGTSQLHQQLLFRPLGGAGAGRAETPIAGLYLASASAHPGGAVHGACGANAARAAVAHDRLQRLRSRLPV
ncbi:NAD(P)/FAD-dependent oxidoreductase [Iamia sp. SCSIO 61187]|uniref:phytoene desaturase family protein n=1 Tax=Iamia sp. SCSIO 61187 TaxID=2722752 RepID=UPI001C626781|nr:NAD(P)/FAD-dependent oxidoreductase [Iamia sp. SCSIO 61187]QYG91885.1 NAD(P)/FAD-dependent oxidoreductase [Iamia sp. SCSIO 61187]